MLTKRTEYAIRALVFIQLLTWIDRRPGVHEVAEKIEAPAAFTAKILQTLTRHGLISSMKRRGGGFYFKNKGEEINLYNVILVMEGDAVFTRCGFGLSECSHKHPCPLHDQYAKIRDGYLRITKSETIQSLAEKVKQGKAVLNLLNLPMNNE